MERHNQIFQDVADQIRDLYKFGQPFRVFHGSSSSTRPRHYSDTNVIDTSMLSQVTSVDTNKRTCLVEPNVPMDRLVEATMPHGLVYPVVMELPGITAGGSLQEHLEKVVRFDTGNGDIIRASREEHEDLFHGAAGAAGTLGVTTLIQCCDKPEVDYVDGILFSKDHGTIIMGELTNTKPANSRIRTLSNAEDPWFYLYVQGQTERLPEYSTVTEYIPLGVYLFRSNQPLWWISIFKADPKADMQSKILADAKVHGDDVSTNEAPKAARHT
ncbi:24-dehydrocholesterol reductase precursor [Fusarium beomiforme]|uniref:24-dehydrocholesterol reductase n=1 Tax=Fusarium beomiforme TaxID=44412 RepID=A0A9P5AST1_9HYPO|nr:24-dehydrocholesterol reductase precursor [Fusarium beomiforme]